MKDTCVKEFVFPADSWWWPQNSTPAHAVLVTLHVSMCTLLLDLHMQMENIFIDLSIKAIPTNLSSIWQGRKMKINFFFFQILPLKLYIQNNGWYCNSSIEATMMLNCTWLLWSYDGIVKQRFLRDLPSEVLYSTKTDFNMYTSLVLNLSAESAVREQYTLVGNQTPNHSDWINTQNNSSFFSFPLHYIHVSLTN